MTPARRAALFFAVSHIATTVPITLAPRTGRRLRLVAALDTVPALAVADAVLRDRPLAARLRWGALSDLSRIPALRYALPRVPRVLDAASLTGAVLATALSTRVN